jgi:hypothetical protein
MRNTFILAIFAILSICRFVSAQETTAQAGQYREERQLLFTMDSDNPYLLFANDQRTKLSVANSIDHGKKTRVWWGSESGVYDCIAVYGITISPDGERAAFIGVDRKGRRHVIIDGQEVGAYGYIFFDTVVFSPDSRRYAFGVSESGQRGKKDCRVICDGEKGEKYHSIVGLWPEFSSDSKHLVYFARENNDWFVVIDSTTGPAFEQTGWGPFFTSDGSRMIYVGVRGPKQYLVETDTTYGPYGEIMDDGYAPVTNELFYVARIDGDTKIFLNGKQYSQDYKSAHFPIFSEDGNHFAFWATDGIADQYLIVDSVERRHFPNMFVSSPFFSDDGGHFYYDVGTTKKMDERLFVVDDSVIWHMKGQFDVLDVSFAPDGSRYGFIWDVDSTEMRGVIDSVEYIGRPWCGRTIFSPDSKRWSLVTASGSDDKSKLIVDGVESANCEMYYPGQRFTPDSKQVACVVKNGGKHFVMIGRQEMTPYDNVYPKTISFDDNGGIIYFGLDGKDLYRVTISPGI